MIWEIREGFLEEESFEFKVKRQRGWKEEHPRKRK